MKITLVIILLSVTNFFSQLKISVYTDKSEYEYGETIKLSCRITNISDTTFQFLAGTYQSCQAEFSFNDFNSWEHTACLATTELLTFEPYSSKIYSWVIDPKVTGLPNNEGTQKIIGKYYFDLDDTIYIKALQFLGGQLSIGYSKANQDSVQYIKDSLSITVLSHSEFDDKVNEIWQVIGYQIDSLISRYGEDTLFNFVEKAVQMQYDSIKDENLLLFYPLHIGDEWQYFVESKIGDRDTSYYLKREIVGVDTCNGKKYFLLSDGMVDCYRYIRIDSANATVLEKMCGEDNECMIDSLAMSPSGDGFINDCYGFVYCAAETTKVFFDEDRSIKAFHWMAPLTCVYCPYRDYEYAEGIGLIYSKYVYPAPEGYDSEYQTMNLIYAKINRIEYGDTTLANVKKIDLDLPLEFSLSQNYPNPFNPSTTIKYSIPTVGTRHASSVRLSIYDVLGREVVTLINEQQTPGNYEVIFNASNLSSGVYYYQLKSGDFIKTKKMVLLR